MENTDDRHPRRRKSDRYSLDENDHDVLIDIKNKFGNLLSLFEDQKEDSDDRHRDHETRIRALEKAILLGIGGLFVLQLIMPFLFKFVIK